MSRWMNIISYRIFDQLPEDDCVTMATKLEMFFDVFCHVVSVCKILLSLS